MVFTLVIYFLICLISLRVGHLAGVNGWWGDSRLDRLHQLESYLVTELKVVQNETDCYGHFMIMRGLSRDLSSICAELAKTRTAIIQCGGTPKQLSAELMQIIIDTTNE